MMSIVAKQRVMMTGLVQELVLRHKPMTAELRFIEPRHQKRMVFYVFVE